VEYERVAIAAQLRFGQLQKGTELKEKGSAFYHGIATGKTTPSRKRTSFAIVSKDSERNRVELVGAIREQRNDWQATCIFETGPTAALCAWPPRSHRRVVPFRLNRESAGEANPSGSWMYPT
jgi:hypothetical protein